MESTERTLYREMLCDRSVVALRRICWIATIIALIGPIAMLATFASFFFIARAYLLLICAVFLTLGTALLREEFRDLFHFGENFNIDEFMIPLYEIMQSVLPAALGIGIVCGIASIVWAQLRHNSKSPVGTTVSVSIAFVLMVISAVIFYAFPYFGLK